MNAREVVANGTLVSTSRHSGMKVYSYKGSLWAVFKGEMRNYSPFAYLWGKA